MAEGAPGRLRRGEVVECILRLSGEVLGNGVVVRTLGSNDSGVASVAVLAVTCVAILAQAHMAPQWAATSYA